MEWRVVLYINSPRSYRTDRRYNDQNEWKKTLKNNPSYFTDPEKQKVLRFAMQRPANYLTEIETYLEKALAEALEEEKTA